MYDNVYIFITILLKFICQSPIVNMHKYTKYIYLNKTDWLINEFSMIFTW